MLEKINLEEILKQHSNICIDDRENVVEAMKEACKQTIELAAENANFGICQNDSGCPCIQESHFIDKQSILDTINQIE